MVEELGGVGVGGQAEICRGGRQQPSIAGLIGSRLTTWHPEGSCTSPRQWGTARAPAVGDSQAPGKSLCAAQVYPFGLFAAAEQVVNNGEVMVEKM